MLKKVNVLSCLLFFLIFVGQPSLAAQAVEAVDKETASFLEQKIFHFTLGQLGSSFLILLLAFLFRGVFTKIVFQQLKAMARKTKMDFDDNFLAALEKPTSFFLLILGIYLSLAKLPLDAGIEAMFNSIFRGMTIVIVVWALIRLVDVFGDLMVAATHGKDSALYGFLPLIKKTMRVFIILVGLLIVVENLGYDVASIIAAFGLGGAALALASKDTVANLFGSLMIVLDRPFKVGDWIQVGNKVDGDVEEIGLRSTKVRTWPKTVISIPNSVLANEYINNWSRMPKRRVKQYIGITYEATADQIDQMVEDIRQLLKDDKGVQQDFILVNFTDFGESSLDILVYYFTTTTAWVEHMNVRQRINTKMMRAVEERGLSIAFPTRSLYLEGDVAKHMAGMAPEKGGPPDSSGTTDSV